MFLVDLNDLIYPLLCIFSNMVQVIRYLKGTMDYCIKITPEKEFKVNTYVDARFDLQATQGAIVCVGTTPVNWYCRKVKPQPKASFEAELYAIVDGVTESTILGRLLSEFIEQPIGTIYTDNQAALHSIINGERQRAKHLNIRWKFVREQLDLNQLSLTFVPGSEQLADILTKPLPKANNAWKTLFHVT